MALPRSPRAAPALLAALPLLLFVFRAEGVRKVLPSHSDDDDAPLLSPEEALPVDVAGGDGTAAAAVAAGGSRAAAEAICEEAHTIRTVTSTLKQLALEADPGEMRVTVAQISDYFVASADSVKDFLQALFNDAARGSATETVDVASLCLRSVKHVADVLKWPLPEWRGHLCAVWSPELRCLDWVPVSGEAVQEKARQLDLATELSHLGDHEAGAPADVVQQAEDGQAGNSTPVPAATFDYSVGDLAVQIVNLFDIYPTDPGLPSSSSFLEASDEGPPIFGPRVRRERYPIWKDTMALSEAWVDNAVRKMAAHPQLLKAWFGSSSPSTRTEVRRVLVGMRNTLGKAKIKVGAQYFKGDLVCSDQSSVMAYVLTWQERGRFVSEKECPIQGTCLYPWYVINVCPRYWLPEFWQQDASRYGTMVHESAHHHGPIDVSYKGSGAYGRAPCLRIAQQSPSSAANNADNFKWYVYYLNRCAGRQAKPLMGSPCSFRARHYGSRRGWRPPLTFISLECDGRPVSGLTVKVLRPSGEYARPAENLGDKPRQPAWKSQEIALAGVESGQTLVLFYESDCAFWEASAASESLWNGNGVHRSKPVMDMADPRGGGRGGQGYGLQGGCRGHNALSGGFLLFMALQLFLI